jgi:hypothetical protein
VDGVDFSAVSSDRAPCWVDLLQDAAAPLRFALVESSIIIIAPLAPPSTSTLQPQIRLTKASTKQLCFRWCLDVLVLPLDFDLESPLQPPATAIHLSFGRLVCAFYKASSIQLQPMLCTAFHPAVASTAFCLRDRRRSWCSSCCSYPVKGPSCISVLSGGLLCKLAA